MTCMRSYTQINQIQNTYALINILRPQKFMNYFLTEPISYKQANVYSASRSLDRPVNGNNVTQIFADNRLISLATSIFRLIMV